MGTWLRALQGQTACAVASWGTPGGEAWLWLRVGSRSYLAAPPPGRPGASRCHQAIAVSAAPASLKLTEDRVAAPPQAAGAPAHLTPRAHTCSAQGSAHVHPHVTGVKNPCSTSLLSAYACVAAWPAAPAVGSRVNGEYLSGFRAPRDCSGCWGHPRKRSRQDPPLGAGPRVRGQPAASKRTVSREEGRLEQGPPPPEESPRERPPGEEPKAARKRGRQGGSSGGTCTRAQVSGQGLPGSLHSGPVAMCPSLSEMAALKLQLCCCVVGIK